MEPHFTEEYTKEIIKQVNIEFALNLECSKLWNLSMDYEYVSIIDQICEKQKIYSKDLQWHDIENEKGLFIGFLTQYNKFLSFEHLKDRFYLLKYFNLSISYLLPFVDMRYANEDWSIAYMISNLRRLLFYDVKMELFEESLHSTRSNRTSPMIILDRHRLERGNCLFLQGFRQLHSVDENLLRKNDRAWAVKLNQEGAMDIGGPYRESMSEFCSDLLPNSHFLLHSSLTTQNNNANNPNSPSNASNSSNTTGSSVNTNESTLNNPSNSQSSSNSMNSAANNSGNASGGSGNTMNSSNSLSHMQNQLNLFIKCPNAQSEIGFNQDKFIPNPSSVSIQQLKQFEFVGKLIGIAIRTKNTLDFLFPSIIWKAFVFLKLELLDLQSIDESICKFIENIRDIHLSIDEESFYDLIFETFSCRSSDGKMIELFPGGKSYHVNWENRELFTNLIYQYRINEFKLITDAVLKGISAIIPAYSLLSYFTWQQLELRVCGHAEFDLNLLKRHTVYVNIPPNHRIIKMFWQVLQSFTCHEKSLFIRFVWGRSRLPCESEFTTPFQLQGFPGNDYSLPSSNHNQDELLPVAHTCFFTVSLPSYSSSDIMRKRLLYAITTCREIDTDFIIQPSGNLSETEDSDDESV